MRRIEMTTAIPAPELNYASLGTGVRLRYVDTGQRTGRPVLLLHGYSDSWFSFSPVLPLLDPALRLIIADQRGHGGSDRPSAGYSPDDMAADAIALLDALGIPSVAAVGHSMGSLVVLRMLGM